MDLEHSFYACVYVPIATHLETNALGTHEQQQSAYEVRAKWAGSRLRAVDSSHVSVAPRMPALCAVARRDTARATAVSRFRPWDPATRHVVHAGLKRTNPSCFLENCYDLL